MIQRRPIESLKPHPDNPRLGDVDAIKESIRVNGWHGAVVTQQSTGFIIAGNHRTQAALELVRGNFFPWPDQSAEDWEKEKARWKAELASLPVHVVACDDDTAKRILLADNRTADRATYDDGKLLRLQAQVLEPEAAMQVLTDPNSNPDEVMEALRVIAAKPKPGRMRGTGYTGEDVEQLALAMEGGQAREWGSQGVGQFQRQEAFAESQSRQMVFALTIDEYDKIMPLLLRIIDDNNGLDTNTDAFLFVMNDWAEKHPAVQP